MLDSKVIDAFHLMWGKFPEAVLLVHKSREILAVNEAAKKLGSEVGMNCAKQGTPESHKGCLADKAIETQQPMFVKSKFGGKDIIAYWIPINGYPEYYVHFFVGL